MAVVDNNVYVFVFVSEVYWLTCSPRV